MNTPRRRCKICTKPLSIYNEGDICFYHNEITKYRYRPVTLCTSYTDKADPLRRNNIPRPGDSVYNDRAFSKDTEYKF